MGENFDRPVGEYTWRAMEEYLKLMPAGNLVPVIKEIRKIGHPYKEVNERLASLTGPWAELLESRRVAMPRSVAPEVTKPQEDLVRRTAQRIYEELTKLISPQGRSEEPFTLEEKSLAYDPREKMLSVRVTFSWPNRDDDTSPHKLSGLLVVYPSPDGSQSGRARFYYDSCSRSLMNISPATALQKLAEGYEITLK